VLRQQIRNYYGDPLGTGIAADDSNYAAEARKVADAGRRWLNATHNTNGIKAIILDVDDTTLMTWNYEIFSNWAFNPTTNGQFVTDQRFSPVFGMVDMVNEAAKEGYAIFFLTGRGAAQEAATLGAPVLWHSRHPARASAEAMVYICPRMVHDWKFEP